MPESDRPDGESEPPRASKPDGGLKDGAAAMAMMVLAIALIVFVVRQL